MTESENMAQTVATLSSALTEHVVLDADAAPLKVLPSGYKVENLERFLPAPTRKRGGVTLRDLASFIAFTKAEAIAGQTRVYADSNRDKPSFTAVFNDHGTEPGWRDHTATYVCPLTPQWLTWTKHNAQAMTQVQFAQFIETNLRDLLPPDALPEDARGHFPDPTLMLEVSREMQANSKVDFKSGTRLTDGNVQFKYEETTQASVRSGTLEVPEAFMVGLSVFEGDARYPLMARLRYRIKPDGLFMWYELDNPHLVVDDAIEKMRTNVAAEVGVPVFNGALVER